MKFLISVLLVALSALAVLAAAPQKKSVIVSYPSDTPDSVLSEAKQAIRDAGGIITHEYKIIKAFAASAPANALDLVRTWGSKYNALIEEDQVVHVLGEDQ